MVQLEGRRWPGILCLGIEEASPVCPQLSPNRPRITAEGLIAIQDLTPDAVDPGCRDPGCRARDYEVFTFRRVRKADC